MKCDRCGSEIPEDDVFEHVGRTLCEDCYIYVLNPPKGCDPWAVRLATGHTQQSGGVQLTDVQQKILDELKREGALLPVTLAERVGLKPVELEREVATLRHMELVKGKKQDGQVYVILFS